MGRQVGRVGAAAPDVAASASYADIRHTSHAICMGLRVDVDAHTAQTLRLDDGM